ncbi:MAG: hypothetical protein J7M03_00580, partial [Candidatus Desulfofervidaceae bacterium]|nr:hypothetical protein [Candidatus Desulfofervidaceae bacterium]
AMKFLSQFGREEKDFTSIIVLPKEDKLFDFEPAIVRLFSEYSTSPLTQAIESMASHLEEWEIRQRR